jgi:hypothetical protein
MTHKRKPRSNSNEDRRFSVGDFLLEIDEALRPLIDLTDMMHEIRADNPNDPCIVPYRERQDAVRAQTRLRLLVRDPNYPDRGDAIALGRTFNAENGEKLWAISVPHELFVRPEGLDRAAQSNITDRVDWYRERRDAIAAQVDAHKMVEAVAARESLWSDLSERGLVVHLPDEKLKRLVGLYEKLPGLDTLGGPQEQLQHFVPYVEALIKDSGESQGKLGAKTLQESAFIKALEELGQEVFRQRHQVGFSENTRDSHHYFPDDFATLLKAGIERGVGEDRLNRPSYDMMPRDRLVAPHAVMHMMQPTTKTTEGHVVTRLKPHGGRDVD